MKEKLAKKSNKAELLAPAGDMEKFLTALHFGADAVYMAGRQFGLRAYSTNFSDDEIAYCCRYAHERGKKVYITVNIYANDGDFTNLPAYIKNLENAGADAVLVSDPGIIELVRETAPKLPIHLSTQANTTNGYAARFWYKQGISRIVCARECSLEQIAHMKALCPQMEFEAFVHGAMCISYSGRCLLSNYLTGRESNRGECVQACRWKYLVVPEGRTESLPVEEDERGTYIFNSRDLNMLSHLGDVIESGVCSLKIEGRMKSPYYVATVANAYRRALDKFYAGKEYATKKLVSELKKPSHRAYTTGFFYGRDTAEPKEYYQSSKAAAESKFIAVVSDWEKGVATVKMRNRFQVGDTLEILSANASFGEKFVVESITDEWGNAVTDCKIVQQTVKIPCKYPLEKYDILRAAE